MTDNSRHTRRRILKLTGGTALAGLAGCTGSGSREGQSSTEETATDAEEQEGSETETGHEEGGHDEEEGGHDEEETTHDEEEGGHDDGEDEHGHGSIGEPTETAEVAVNTTDDGEAHFSPHVTRVTNGGTVSWVLESGSHTATAYHPDNGEPQLVPDGADSWASGMLSEKGETFEHTFETEGIYHYYCVPHESSGMIGSVIVGEPDAHGQPALEEPPSEKPKAVREKIEELNAMCNEALGHDH